jgi:hypothetical protein
MGPNLIILPIAALIPLITGFIWYHPKVLGKAWMQETSMTEEKAKNTNMFKVLTISYIFSLFLAFMLMEICIHQFGIYGLFFSEPGFGEAGTETMLLFDQIVDRVGSKHLHFGHGLFHGTGFGLMIALPVLAINSMFEQKTWKYIWINVGYFTLSFSLMGGLVSQFGWVVK